MVEKKNWYVFIEHVESRKNLISVCVIAANCVLINCGVGIKR